MAAFLFLAVILISAAGLVLFRRTLARRAHAEALLQLAESAAETGAARQALADYNAAARGYNEGLRRFPGVLAVFMFGFAPLPYGAHEAEQQ